MTDNRGNGSALNKLMLMKRPASAVIMELASFMKKKGIRASVEWEPPEWNREADALANGFVEEFSPSRRLHVHPSGSYSRRPSTVSGRSSGPPEKVELYR